MGSYLNPGNFSFRGSLRSKICVDKSKLLAKTNEALCTEQKYICVSRREDLANPWQPICLPHIMIEMKIQKTYFRIL